MSIYSVNILSVGKATNGRNVKIYFATYGCRYPCFMTIYLRLINNNCSIILSISLYLYFLSLCLPYLFNFNLMNEGIGVLCLMKSLNQKDDN